MKSARPRARPRVGPRARPWNWTAYIY